MPEQHRITIPRGNGLRSVRVDPDTAEVLKRLVRWLDAEDLSIDHTMGDAVRWAVGLPLRTANGYGKLRRRHHLEEVSRSLNVRLNGGLK